MQVLAQDKGLFIGQEIGSVVSQASLSIAAVATVGAATLTPDQLLADVIRRTGSTAAYIDTMPLGTAMEANAVFAAMPIGSNRKLYISNQVAFARTQAAAAGFTLSGNGTAGTAQAASTVIECILSKVALNSYNLEILG